MDIRIVNLNTKTLREFVEGDTLYVSKIIGGMQYNYYCKFLRLERGVVVAEILKNDRDYDTKNGIITARASKCYLWGRDSQDKWERCHWFKSLDEPVN